MGTPYLSIVVTARHDNYGGDYRDRVVGPMRFNDERLSQCGVPYEIVLVEWDPLPDRPLLAELVVRELPEGVADRVLTRIVVAREYQAAMAQNPRIGYLEYIARNVGIRRAAAPFVLVTNVDILLGREIVERLAERRLEAGTLYRAPRYDIKMGVDQAGLSWDTLENPANQVRRPVLQPPLYTGAAADFLLADRETFFRIRGFNEIYRAARAGLDVNILVKAHGAGVPIADLGVPVYHLNHVGSMRISKTLYRDSRADTPWGDLDWHSAAVTYNNPDGWGLGDAPVRRGKDGTIFLDFDWRAVPPLVELKRLVLPAQQHQEEAIR
jgi:hypothetical protein